MGCAASVAASKDDADSSKDRGNVEESVGANSFDVVPFRQVINPKSSKINLDLSLEMKKLKCEGEQYTYTASYCFVCQKGYYPDDLNKANQDSYLILESMLGDDSAHLFGVFDGHGTEGDLCSHFAADQFGYSLCKELQKYGGPKEALSGPKMKKVYTSAFVKTNKLLRQSKVPDKLSGTTGVTIAIQGETLYVGNVGDSRAIIASEVDGSLKYSALSSDQTPFRKDERERLKLKGASIFTMDQIEGNEVIHENWGAETGDDIDDAAQDPPRVWDKTLQGPGCAFTRSIGDSVAEAVGVYAEPEILKWPIEPSDRFAVVASDGVFEFLPSQTVVDMIAQFEDPIEGGQHVVAEAYRLWLQNEDRTDDITIVIVLFEDMKPKAGITVAPSDRKLSPRVGAEDSRNAKPVRKMQSNKKRKDISEAWDTSADEEFDFAANSIPKSPEEQARLSSYFKKNFMFSSLSAAQKEQLFSVMKLRVVKPDETVIVEGDAGDEMYIIDDGEFNVLKRNAEGQDSIVFTYSAQMLGSAFGELSLMYGQPRSAGIVAKTNGRLWCLGRLAFRAVLMKKNPVGLLKLCKSIPLFHDLDYPTLQRLCEEVQLEEYKDGEVIATKPIGEDQFGINWVIAIVTEGSVQCLPEGVNLANLADKEKEELVEQGNSERDGKSAITKSRKGGAKGQDKYSREQGAFFGAAELGKTVDYVLATGRCKIGFISKTFFEGVAGTEAVMALAEVVTAPDFRGKPTRKTKGVMDETKNFDLPRNFDYKSRDDFVLSMSNIQLGDYAILGTFNSRVGGKESFVGKIIAKQLAQDARMDTRLLLEKNILCALDKTPQGSGPTNACVAKLRDYFQNERIIMVSYEDMFMCDLALAIQNNSIEDDNKTYYSACMYSAVAALHDIGVMHRFINPGSIYINMHGVPKLADLRYCKLMDGQKSFTICGDPLYFAPEIVKQLGYDYSADLWSLGCTIFELFEGHHPIGTTDDDEKALFLKISSFEEGGGSLNFSQKSHKKVRSVVTSLLTVKYTKRCGYKSAEEVLNKKMFSRTNWATLGRDFEAPWDLISHVDTNNVFIESNLEECRENAAFKAF